MPDANYVTHINYAFAHVNDSFDGIRIDNERRLKHIIELKVQHPSLNVLLSIGGWGSGRFSEMAANEINRRSFARDCLRVINEFGLDGIDIDWEYPTSSSGSISASPDDTQNYTLLMGDIRKEIGGERLLTLASAANAKYIDFHAIEAIVDFVNVMTYDMGNPPNHHAGLYASSTYGKNSVDAAISAHLAAGIPATKLVLGIPFYGRGNRDEIPNFIDYKKIIELEGYTERWDEEAKAPYLENTEGKFICTYETPKSIIFKCEYLLQRDLLGAMYWEYGGDTEDGVLRKAVYEGLNK